MKKINKCPGGRYQEFQLKLLQESEIKCEVCSRLLNRFGYDSIEMLATVQAWVDGTYVTSVKEGRFDRKLKQQIPDIDDGEESPEDHDQKAQALAYIQTLDPMFTLLRPMAFTKKVPLQCKVCTSKNWPNGRVIEGSAWKVKTIKHFVTQHCRSTKHLSRVRQINDGVVIMNKVSCGALHFGQ